MSPREYTPAARVVALVLSLAVLHPRAALAQVTLGSGGGTFNGGAVTGATSFLDGTNFSILNTADPTKKLNFDLAGVTTANTITPEWAGTGAGRLRLASGALATPSYGFSADVDTGFYYFSGLIFGQDSNEILWMTRSTIDGSTRSNTQMVGLGAYCFNATSATSAIDTCWRRSAAGVFIATNGSSGIRGFVGGGSAVASADPLPVATGNVFHVTGTTNFTNMTTTGLSAGACYTLIFDGILTITDGGNMKLSANYTTSADDTLTVCFDGTSFFETGRSVN